MNLLSYTPLSEGRLHTASKPFIINDLKIFTHVWIRVDQIRCPLKAPYNGPFEEIDRNEKISKFNDLQDNHKLYQ